MSPPTEDPPESPSLWSPLRRPMFRALWTASLASNFGIWVHDVGVAWLMTDLAAGPQWVTLTQTAVMLPFFLLALPAGAIADVVDRRRLLLATQLWVPAAAATLGVVTLCGWASPPVLLATTFCLSCGLAMAAPAWQTVIPELVPRRELPSAFTLAGVSFNIARSLGPAIGGLLVAWAGPGAAFLLNAASYAAVATVVWRWRPAPRTPDPARPGFAAALLAGPTYVAGDPVMRAASARMAAFILPAIALWGMLPLVARYRLGLSSTGYGLMLGCLGGGALLGAALLPRLRSLFSADAIVAGGSVVFAAALLGAGTLTDARLLAPVLVAGGTAWMTVLTTLHATAQMRLPDHVRARAMSVYLLVFAATVAAGAAGWGAVAERYGIGTALPAAAGTMLVLAAAAAARFRLSGERDPAPLRTPLVPSARPVTAPQPTAGA